jgi:hypothetical protein
MAKTKSTNNDPQNTTQKTKDRATWISLETGVISGAPDGWEVSGLLMTSFVLL